MSSEPAFEQLHREHGDRVYRYCLRLCGGNVTEAQDVAQETFLRAYRSSVNVRHGRAVAVWILRIAHTEWIRYQARKRETVSLDEVRELPDPRSDPGRTELNRLWLESTIARLPEQQRAALWLVKGEGLTHREAAEILGIPQGTLQFHVHEALRFLRKQVSEERRLPGALAFLFVLLLQRELRAAPATAAAPPAAAGIAPPLPRTLVGGVVAAGAATALAVVPVWNHAQARPWDPQTSAILRIVDRTPSAYASGYSRSRKLPGQVPDPVVATAVSRELSARPWSGTRTSLEFWYERPGRYLWRSRDEYAEMAIRLTSRDDLIASRTSSKPFQLRGDRSIGRSTVAPFSFFTRDGVFREALRSRKGIRVSEERTGPEGRLRRLLVEQTVRERARWSFRRWAITLDAASRPARVEYLHRGQFQSEAISEGEVVLDRIVYGTPFPDELFSSPQPR